MPKENRLKYVIFDWMDACVEEFESKEEALKEFNRQRQDAIRNNEEFDKVCFQKLAEFNNID